MATDEWLAFNGVEIVNLARTVQLARVLGVSSVWTTEESVQWIEDALGGSNYDDITTAPWYDSGVPASAEFAGLVPLAIPALDDSTREASTIEYITDGGNSSKPRNSTLAIVASAVLVASTQRGADYGKRWLDRVLAGGRSALFCSGVELRYFQYEPDENAFDPEAPPQVHRRDVTTTRAVSVTKKWHSDCAALWTVTFTWTANDPFEYGDPIEQFAGLGIEVVGPGVVTSGDLVLVEAGCPVYDYSPVYDPLYPALVPPPSAPRFYPDGWSITDGDEFLRYWVRLGPVEPSALNLVPEVTLFSDVDARMVRFTVWPADAEPEDLCGWLWSVILTYQPADQQFTVDGEQKASYVWDGSSPIVRRADSLVYGPGASPVDWLAFNDPLGLLVTLDLFAEGSGGFEGAGGLEASLSLVPKSD